MVLYYGIASMQHPTPVGVSVLVCHALVIIPICYFFTISFRIMENSVKNRMHAHNIAIVFGPTLLAPREEHGNIAVNMVYQNQVIEYILLEYDNVLG